MLRDILLLTPVYVTLFWSIVLNFHDVKKNQPKVFLGWFMLAAFLVYLSHFFYFTNNYIAYYYIDSFYILAYLLVYPLYHVYVRLLTVDQHFSLKKHGRFLILPLGVFLFTLSGYLIMGKEEGIQYVRSVLTERDDPVGFQKFMWVLYVVGRLLFLGQVVFYLVLNFKLIKQNNQRLKDYYSNIEMRNLDWLQFFNVSLSLTSIGSFLLAVIGRNYFMQNDLLLMAPSIVFSIMLFSIGLLGEGQNASYTESIEIDEPEIEPSVSQLKSKMEALFEDQKIHKNPNLKIWDIASMLGTNRTYVSRLINNVYSRHFSAHVNFYRVREAKQLISSERVLSNQQIAELSGFGSVNSLNRAFLNHEGVTVNQFRNSVR